MHCVNVIAGNNFAEVVVGFAVSVAVLLVHAFHCVVACALFYVGDGNVLDIAPTQECTQVAPAHVADADAGHDDTVTWRGVTALPQHRRRDQIGQCHRCCRCFEKCSSTMRRAPALRWFALLVCHVFILSWSQCK